MKEKWIMRERKKPIGRERRNIEEKAMEREKMTLWNLRESNIMKAKYNEMNQYFRICGMK